MQCKRSACGFFGPVGPPGRDGKVEAMERDREQDWNVHTTAGSCKEKAQTNQHALRHWGLRCRSAARDGEDGAVAAGRPCILKVEGLSSQSSIETSVFGPNRKVRLVI